ncbi:hypothetical protein [Streptomyces chryseus]|uniref:Uncharacterized protein n=1 Tax=Streptomyces chryseus TaxID=68186 RepID=A0ABQ3DFP3_9ACTN|nr:hypothetical protein [Streptomyces chryseus]GHA86759.1 hypothetical protein GCM10010346_06740 [Streptomyces chryseus]
MPSVCSTQLTGAKKPKEASGLALCSAPPSSGVKPPSIQWPAGTASRARARRPSTARSRWAGVRASILAARALIGTLPR